MTTEINNNSLIVPSLTATNMSVTGIIYNQGGLEAGSGGTASLYVETGKVGVNTETPNEHLTVVGNISASSGVYFNNHQAVKTVTTNVPGTSAITTILAVSALPASPDPTTVYIVI